MHYTGILALAGALILLVNIFTLFKRRKVNKLGILAYLVLLVDWIFYLIAFAVQDYTLKPVYETSSRDLPLIFKVASSWSSGGGSLFLLTAVLSIIALIHGRYHRDARLDSMYGALILSSLTLSFLNGAFSSFHKPVITGMGLNPLLKSPWIYPHPLSTFTAYALISASAVSLYSGHWRASDLLAKVGWLLLTLGIAMGGYWSYITFGWGGYWAWDPVETSELTPWLALTAVFHVRSLDRKLSYATHMTAAGSVFLAILVTRVGISPLHSFASPKFMTSIITLALVTLFIVGGIRRSKGIGEGVKKATSSPYRMGLIFSYFSLFMMFMILFMVLAEGSIGSVLGMNMNVPQMDSGIEFFHPVLFPFALLLLISLPMCTLGNKISWREILGLLGGLSIVSVILLYQTFRGDLIWSPDSSMITNLMISVLLPFTVAGLFSGLTALYIYARERNSVMTSISLLHAAMALTMLGIILSGPFAYNRSYFKDVKLPLGQEAKVYDERLMLKNYKYDLYGGSVDLYTPYAGKSEIYKRASLIMLDLFTNTSQDLKKYENGERKLEESGIMALYRYTKRGLLLNGTYQSTAEGMFVNTISANVNTSKELEDLGSLIISISNPLVVGSLNTRSNKAIFKIMVIGNVKLLGNISLKDLSFTKMNLNFSEPLKLSLAGGTLKVSKASLIFFDLLKQRRSIPKKVDNWLMIPNSTLVIENGIFSGSGSRSGKNMNIKIPAAIVGEDVSLYLAFNQRAILSDTMKIALKSGLANILSNSTYISRVIDQVLPSNCSEIISREIPYRCLGYLPVPKELPEGAKLSLTLIANSGKRKLEIRFDANGEVQGIHGLVAHVLPVSNGLGDTYLVFNPPMVKHRRWSTGFHELMVYYLSKSFQGLREGQKLALASLFTSAYLSQTIQESMITPYTLDLYDLASGFNVTNSTLRSSGALVQVKDVPYVHLIWWGVILMSLAELYIVIAGVRKSKKRGEEEFNERSSRSAS